MNIDNFIWDDRPNFKTSTYQGLIYQSKGSKCKHTLRLVDHKSYHYSDIDIYPSNNKNYKYRIEISGHFKDAITKVANKYLCHSLSGSNLTFFAPTRNYINNFFIELFKFRDSGFKEG